MSKSPKDPIYIQPRQNEQNDAGTHGTIEFRCKIIFKYMDDHGIVRLYSDEYMQ